MLCGYVCERTPSRKMQKGDKPEDSDLLLPFEAGNLSREYKEYLRARRNNLVASIQKLPILWKSFLLLDQIWFTEFDDLGRLREPEKMFPLILLMNATSGCAR